MKWWQIKKRDADLARELRSDLELEEQEQQQGGISEEEARYAALRAFGNPTLIREQTRAIWSWNWLESLARDLRFSLRTLRHTPGFTIIAILVMALGIGANVTLFTVVRGVLLKPLPFHDPDRLVMLYEAGLHEDDTAGSNLVAGGMYAEWKNQNRSYSSLALVQSIRVGLSGSGGQLPEKLDSALLSWDMLRTLGVQPALGRDFTQADDNPAASGTVLLSWGLWKRRFGGDPAILNKTISLDAQPHTLIGIMPAWFDFPDPSTQLWTPVYPEKREDTMTSFSNSHV
jgi:MacB-like periplasmic core domain